MFTKNIKFKNFIKPKNSNKDKYIRSLIKEKHLLNKYPLLNSLTKKFQYSYQKKKIKKFKSYSEVNLIGMGGSTLGAEAIYDFLNNKIKKNFMFYNNIQFQTIPKTNKKKINLIISKSGNTLETISNLNLLLQKQNKNKNIFLCEKKNNFLSLLAKKLKADIFEHKNYIGGRYSVLSESAMFPAALMGLKIKKFKNLEKLINNKSFSTCLNKNVATIYSLFKRKINNSVILNYDSNSIGLAEWYKQITSESLGKKGMGITPIISNCPKDHHSILQLYLDGPKNKFFTFFSSTIDNKRINSIVNAQSKAVKNVFKKKKFHVWTEEENSGTPQYTARCITCFGLLTWSGRPFVFY